MTVGLVVEILGDASKLKGALGGASKDVQQSTGKMGGAIGGLNMKTAALAGAVGIAGVAIAGFTDAAAEDAAEQERLEAAMRASGAATGDWAAVTDTAIKAAQDKAFSDTAAREALISLTTATGSATEAAELMGPAMDIARFANVDLAVAADAVAKAQAGQDGALRKLMPGLEKGATAADTLAAATEGAAGQADTYADSAAGMKEKSGQAFGELGETIGSVFLPVMEALLPLILLIADALAVLAGFLADNKELVLIVAGVVGVLAAGLLALNAAVAAYNAIQTIMAAKTTIMTGAQWLLNAALTANPIGLVVAAIVGLIAVLVLAYKNSETFRKIVDAAFKAVLGAAKAVFDWIKANWPLLLAILLGPFGLLLGLVIKNLDKIKAAVGRAVDFIKGLIKPLMDAIGNIGKAINDLPDLPSISLPFLASSPAAGPGAQGASSREAPTPVARGITVNVYTTGDGIEAEQAVVRAVRRVARINGGVVPALSWQGS